MADTRPWQRARVHVELRASRSRLADRFHELCEAVVVRLPFGLRSVIAPTFLGFCLINGLTFGVDLAILTGLHSGLRLPVPIAATAAYVCAFALSYVLNRTFNFQSHAGRATGCGLCCRSRRQLPGFHPRRDQCVGGHWSALPAVASSCG